MSSLAAQHWWQDLVLAIRHWQNDEVARLLALSGNLDRAPHPPFLLTPLCEAARVGNVTALERLLDAGADIGLADHGGSTALHWATKMECVEAAWTLLRRGASVHVAAEDGALPLHGVALYFQRPTDPSQPLPDPSWLELGLAMLEAGADGHAEVGGESSFDQCPALRAAWEHRLLQRATPDAKGENNIIRP